MGVRFKDSISDAQIKFSSVVKCVHRIVTEEKSSFDDPVKVERQKLKSLFISTINQIDDLSRKHELPLITVVRNSIANARKDDVVVYKLLLEYGSTKSSWLGKDWIPGLLSYLSDQPTGHTTVFNLARFYLLFDKMPTRASIRSFCAEYPGLDFQRVLWKVALKRDFSDGDLIKEILATSTYGANLKKLLEISIYLPHRLRFHLDSPKSDHDTPPHHISTVEQTVDRQIAKIGDLKLRHCLQFLAKPLSQRARFLLHLSRKDRSQVVRNLPQEDIQETMREIARRGDYASKFPGIGKKKLFTMCEEWEGSFWGEMLWHSSSKRAMNQILSAVGNDREFLVQWCVYYAYENDCSWPKNLAACLLTVCNDSELMELFDTYDFLRLVKNIEPGRFDSKIRTFVSITYQQHQEILSSIMSTAAVKSALDSIFFLPTFKEIIRQFVDDPSQADAREIVECLRPENNHYESFLRNLAAEFFSIGNVSGPYWGLALDFLCQAVELDDLINYIPAKSNVAKTITRQFLAKPSKNKARLIAKCLSPENNHYESFSRNLTAGFRSSAEGRCAFYLLCSELDNARIGTYIPLTSLVDVSREKLWIEYLASERDANDTPPKVLIKTLKEGDPKSLGEALKLRPDIFGRVACSRLPIKELLSFAFIYPKVAVQVLLGISRRRRLAELPWVRKTWSDRPNKQTAYEVALLFSLADAHFLLWLANRIRVPLAEPDRGKQFDDMYRTYRLPKKVGGFRIVTVPDRDLKRLQRRLLDAGFSDVPLSTAAHGFRKKRSILTNAVPHVGKKMVCNVDIDSFFPNTKYDQILRACRRLAGGNISERAAHFVADLCSYNGALPTGAPTSPAISNIILSTIDEVLIKTTQRFGICYTRYADDLTFSGHGDTHRILPFVERLLAEKGYHLDPDKINLFRKGRRQSVTGLVVNEKPNLPRRVRKQLRAAVHHRITGKKPFWHDRVMSDAELMGRLSHLRMVQPEEASKLFRLLNATVTPEEEKIG